MPDSTRRGFLRTVGAAAAATLLPGQATAATGWDEIRSPTSNDLRDVVRATPGAVAVGGGGVVLVRSAGRWTTRRTTGINGQGRNLTAAGATDDGDRVWFAGDSGALAAYDPGKDRLLDLSAPEGYTGSFADVAVTGPAGRERVRLADESGRVHVGVPASESESDGGRSAREGWQWTSLKPGGGSTVPALAAHCRGRGYAIDTNGCTHALSHGDWTNIGEASVNLHAVAAARRSQRERSRHGSCRCRSAGSGGDDTVTGTSSSEPNPSHCERCSRVVVAGGNGTLATFDGEVWRRRLLGGGTIRGLAVGPGGRYAVGDSGAVFADTGGSNGWQRTETPTGQTLRAVSRGAPLIAVGDGGTILEK